MITRRKIIIALGAATLVSPLSSLAQPQKIYRVGTLVNNGLAETGHRIEWFAQELRKLGYIEGKNILIERRFAEGEPDRLPALAAELVQLKVDVILTTSAVGTQAAKQATRTIPIVFATVGDPVGSGFVASLAKPGGNITGTSSVSVNLSAKRLQILKEAFPKISRIAVFVSSIDPGSAFQLAEIQRAAKALKMEVLSLDMRRRDDFEQGFVQSRKWRADSLYFIQTPVYFNNIRFIVEFAATNRLPTIYSNREFVEAGGIMSYGANLESNYRRAATYVDKILTGAQPGDIPVEQPTAFELFINRKTAKALGLTIPQSLLISATKIIE